eukprot:gene19910-21856_t
MTSNVKEVAITIDVDEKRYVSGIISLPLKRSTWTDYGFIITHGAGGDMNSHQIVCIANKCATAGLTVLRFTCKTPNLKYRVKCFTAALELLRLHDDFKVKGCIVAGRSMGARVAAELATVYAEEQSHNLGFILGCICLSYPLHRPRQHRDLRVSHVNHLSVPALFISGTRDEMCRKDLLENLLDRINADTKIHWLENAGHSLSVKELSADCNGVLLERITQWCLEWSQSLIMAER